MTKYFTGKPCKNGHIADRYKSSNDCTICAANRRDKHRKEDPQAARDYSNRSKLKHRDKILEKGKLYRERTKEAQAAYKLEYYAKNQDKYNIWVAQRRARKHSAEPLWLTKEQKREISLKFYISSNISDITGTRHHVDHIVPLKGENVCGLHVPWNLRVLPGRENLSKSNSMLY